VILVNSTSNNISVLLGHATVQQGRRYLYRARFTHSSSTNPSSVIVADFNGDGFLDLAVANQVTIPYLFSGKWRWNVYGISWLALQAAEYRHDQGVKPVAMVSANFRIKTFTTNTNSGARKWTSQL